MSKILMGSFLTGVTVFLNVGLFKIYQESSKKKKIIIGSLLTIIGGLGDLYLFVNLATKNKDISAIFAVLSTVVLVLGLYFLKMRDEK